MARESEQPGIVVHTSAEDALTAAKRTIRKLRGSHLRRNLESADFAMDIILDGIIVERHIFKTVVCNKSLTKRRPQRIENMALYQ